MVDDKLKRMTVAFIGGGNMGEALIGGILDAGSVPKQHLRASDKRKVRRDHLAEHFGIGVFEDNREAVKGADVVVMAVKPQIYDTVVDEISSALSSSAVLISIAAGKSIAGTEARLRDGARVVRTMPNVNSLVREGATAIVGGSHATEDDIAITSKLFECVGIVRTFDDEVHLDAVTGLSGSGPAFIFLVIEALADAGVKVGLSRWDAHDLAAQAVLGAARLVIQTQEHTGRLKDMVCSPGGTAIAGISALEQGGLRTTLINAVEVATRRSRELGDGG
ncbi:MAG: pyrroline-5-carboxylate reductase [Myxococcales bacterium]|nr:pyrroline-5-carboxylate reductase [Myxococcales bacterium]